MIMNKKICTKCNREYDATIEFFAKNNRCKDGLQQQCKQCHIDQYQLNRERVLKDKADNHLKNPEKYRDRDKERYKKYSEEKKSRTYIQRRSFAKYIVFKDQLSQYNEIRCDENGYVQVKCTYCNRWYNPTVNECQNRIRSIKSIRHGEGKYYCSNNCKSECPTYRKKLYPKGYKKGSSREVDPLIRKMALERDNYECQKCKKTIDEIPLHVHHIEGATEQPLLSNDLTNVITYCIDCHKEVHLQVGCTYYDYRCDK